MYSFFLLVQSRPQYFSAYRRGLSYNKGKEIARKAEAAHPLYDVLPYDLTKQNQRIILMFVKMEGKAA